MRVFGSDKKFTILPTQDKSELADAVSKSILKFSARFSALNEVRLASHTFIPHTTTVTRKNFRVGCVGQTR